MVVKRKQRLHDVSAIAFSLLQIAANVGNCPPKAEVTSSNLVGRANQINNLDAVHGHDFDASNHIAITVVRFSIIERAQSFVISLIPE
jgi:hypothetical protein